MPTTCSVAPQRCISDLPPDVQLDTLAQDDGYAFFVKVSDYQDELTKLVATSLLTALEGAVEHKTTEHCLAWVNEGGCVWTEGHPDEKTYCE